MLDQTPVPHSPPLQDLNVSDLVFRNLIATIITLRLVTIISGALRILRVVGYA
jgi:hypothetical protein